MNSDEYYEGDGGEIDDCDYDNDSNNDDCIREPPKRGRKKKSLSLEHDTKIDEIWDELDKKGMQKNIIKGGGKEVNESLKNVFFEIVRVNKKTGKAQNNRSSCFNSIQTLLDATKAERIDEFLVRSYRKKVTLTRSSEISLDTFFKKKKAKGWEVNGEEVEKFQKQAEKVPKKKATKAKKD